MKKIIISKNSLISLFQFLYENLLLILFCWHVPLSAMHQQEKPDENYINTIPSEVIKTSPYLEWSQNSQYFFDYYVNSLDESLLGESKNLCLAKIYFNLKNGQRISYLIPHIFISSHYEIKEPTKKNQGPRMPYGAIDLPFTDTTPFTVMYRNFSHMPFEEKIVFLEYFNDFFQIQFEKIHALKIELTDTLCMPKHANILHHIHPNRFYTLKKMAQKTLTNREKDTKIQKLTEKQEETKKFSSYSFLESFLANFFTEISNFSKKSFEELNYPDINALSLDTFKDILQKSLNADNLCFHLPLNSLTREQFSILEDLFILELFYHSEQIGYYFVMKFLSNLPEALNFLPEEKREIITHFPITSIDVCFHTNRDPCFQCQEKVLFSSANIPYPFQIFLTGGENYPSKTLDTFELTLNSFKKFYSPEYQIFISNRLKTKTRPEIDGQEKIKLFTPEEFLRRQEKRLN